MTWGIDDIPIKNFYKLKVFQKIAIILKYGSQATKKATQPAKGKRKIIAEQMDILASNDTKVTKMNNAIMTSIPTKDELNAQKAAIASARLIPNVQYAPGSIVVSLQICVSCVGGLDIPEGCYEEFVDWMQEITIKGAVGVVPEERKDHNHTNICKR